MPSYNFGRYMIYQLEMVFCFFHIKRRHVLFGKEGWLGPHPQRVPRASSSSSSYSSSRLLWLSRRSSLIFIILNCLLLHRQYCCGLHPPRPRALLPNQLKSPFLLKDWIGYFMVLYADHTLCHIMPMPLHSCV